VFAAQISQPLLLSPVVGYGRKRNMFVNQLADEFLPGLVRRGYKDEFLRVLHLLFSS
jgi:hypothetical protein